jgi:hypothetical protein
MIHEDTRTRERTNLYQVIFLWCVLLFALGTQIIETLLRETQQTILNLNIVLAVGFIDSCRALKLWQLK